MAIINQGTIDENKNVDLKNNSGQGPNSPVLDIVSKKFNWGAFLLNWIWGLGNRTFITLVIFLVGVFGIIPGLGIIAGLGCNIWFGIKGNEWAWQNKRWESIEQFHLVQKKWAIGGLIALFVQIILVVLVCIAIIIPVNMNSTSDSLNKTTTAKSVYTISDIATRGEYFEKKCTPTSVGLASYFANEANITRHIDNIVETRDGLIWTFYGNGSCNNVGDCSVTITNSRGFNETIPLTVENGYLKVHSDDLMNK